MALDESGAETVDEFSLAVVAIREHTDSFWESGREIGQAAASVARQLEDCGAAPVWVAERTDFEGIRRFIGSWIRRPDRTSSILYWVGHGSSDGVFHNLVTSESGSCPAVDDSLITRHLADYLRQEAAGRGNLGTQSSDAWTVVVLDTCAAGVGLSNLNSELTRHPPREPKHLLILATTDGGTGYLGGFDTALAKAIGGFAANDPHIHVRELVARLVAGLGEDVPPPWGGVPRHALIRNPEWLGRAVTGPIDAVEDHVEELREAGRLPGAAQPGSELGDWFTGREHELAQLESWLAMPGRVLQVVTGPAGSGKSALLKRFVAQARPPEFDATVLGTGKTIRNLAQLIAAALPGEPLHEPLHEPERLLQAIAQAPDRHFRIAVDALDEAVDPHVVAATLLRPLAQMENVKLLVATRRSLAEREGNAGPDDRGILEALGSSPACELALGPDRDLTREYVRHYLGPAFADGNVVERLAERVARRQQPLLFARLVVSELLADADEDLDGHLDVLLDGDVASVFAHARARLERVQPKLLALLRTLVFAAGRGIPRLGGVWLTAAQALHPDQQIGDVDIAEALTHRPREASQVAPYIMLDTEHDQSTYRLSHRAFLEQFERSEQQAGSSRSAHTSIARALLQSASDEGSVPYVARYLPWHLARSESEAWRDLAARPRVLDALAPGAVAAEAMGVAAECPLPPEILGVVASRHRIVHARSEDREGLRQIGMASCAPDGTYARPADGRSAAGMAWSVRCAVMRSHPVHLTLQARSRVTSLACLEGAEGVRLLAAGCRDGSVCLWDALSGEPFGGPVEVSNGVLAIAGLVAADDEPSRFVFADAHGCIGVWDTLARRAALSFRARSIAPVRVLAPFYGERTQLIAADCEECAVQVWSADGNRLARFEGHSGDVRAIAGPPRAEGTVMASAGKDEAVRLWDHTTGRAVGEPLERHRAWVTALTRFYDADARDVLVSGGDDGAILVWDISDPRRVPPPLQISHPGGRVQALCVYEAGDGRVHLVSGGQDGTVRVWDPVTGEQICAPLAGHSQPVTALAPCGGAGAPVRLASVAGEDQVCVWNPGLARPVTATAGHAIGAVNAIATEGRDDEVVAGSGDDGVVRFWDRHTGLPVATPVDVCAGAAQTLVAYRDAGDVERVASADGDVVVTWRREDPQGSRRSLYGHEKPVQAIACFRSGGSLLLASGDQGGEIRVWNATTGEPFGDPIRCGFAPVRDIAAYVGKDGETHVVAVGDRTIRAWSLRSPAAEPRLLGEHTSWVMRVATFASSEGEPRLVTAGVDATMRLWDPDAEAQLDRLDCGGKALRALAVSVGGEAGALIAGGDDGGTIWVWAPFADALPPKTIPLELPIRALAWRGADLLVGTTEGHAVLDMSPLRERDLSG
jgi:WD40 repeat protein